MHLYCTVFVLWVGIKTLTLLKRGRVMTQLVINVDNPDIIPSLRKVLGQIKGVTIEKSRRKPSEEDEKQAILKSIEKGYREVRAAQKKGEKLPDLDNLINELKSAE